jgi:hypothetical protein
MDMVHSPGAEGDSADIEPAVAVAASGSPSAEPLRLRVHAIPDPNGRIVGAWWPHTRHPSTELSALVAGLEPLLGIVNHIAMNVTQWGCAPARIRVGERDVRVSWFAYTDPHAVTVWHDDKATTLRVIPPETDEREAELAMAAAVRSPGPSQPADPAGEPELT